MNSRSYCVLILLAGVMIVGCSTGPAPIVAGRDQCMHCKMAISDLRFASQYVSDKGKRYTFDSIECMVRSIRTSEVPIRSVWVADYEMSDAWVPAEQAVFLYSGRIHSPMGASLSAFGPPATASEIRQTYGGTVMTWPEVQAWLDGSEDAHIAGKNQESRQHPAD